MNKQYKNIVILTGAGISAESGLATFRSSNGLWNNHRVEDVASVEGFRRNPALVHDFYNDLKLEIQKAKPNPAHLAITRLQNEYPAEISVVTQNVDTLHEKAGNKNIYHIPRPDKPGPSASTADTFWKPSATLTPNRLRPVRRCRHDETQHVFFGENLLCMDKVETLLRSCDLFVSIALPALFFRPPPLFRPPNTMAPIPLSSRLNQPQTTFILTGTSTARPDKRFPLMSTDW